MTASPGRMRFAVDNAGFLDDADDGAAEVVIAGLIDAGHLGGFAADEGAAVAGAAAREAGDELGEDVGLELAGADVIEEKKRFGAEHGDVVDAMVDEVLADGVVAVHGEGDFELGADAVDAGDEDGLAVFFDIEGEEAAEAADLAEDFGAVGGGEELRERGFDAIAEVNVHSRAGISFLFHREANTKWLRCAAVNEILAAPGEDQGRKRKRKERSGSNHLDAPP